MHLDNLSLLCIDFALHPSYRPERTEQCMKDRVYCLYRVSTGKQVDYDDKCQADIPMQRKACHHFAEEKGWTIVHEEQEDGVSGHKVRAENRDKLQIIKEHSRQGKFDILLVFMFDRIGRIADETLFVVEWFAKNGIRVWSTQEGEQRFENHTDKLTNYIRFWQADAVRAVLRYSRTCSSFHRKCLTLPRVSVHPVPTPQSRSARFPVTSGASLFCPAMYSAATVERGWPSQLTTKPIPVRRTLTAS